jgi:hypothetical protein
MATFVRKVPRIKFGGEEELNVFRTLPSSAAEGQTKSRDVYLIILSTPKNKEI